MALDTTLGGEAADSYVSLADATTYLADKPGTAAWGTASTPAKESYLRRATKLINRCRFWGWPVTTTQALEFPRYYHRCPSDRIPSEIVDATCEQAFHLLANVSSGGQTLQQKLQAQGVTGYTLGNLSEQFGGGAAAGSSASPLSALCPDAQALLRRWICRSGEVRDRDRERRLRAMDSSCEGAEEC